MDQTTVPNSENACERGMGKTMEHDDAYLAENPDSTEAIPTLDISAYLAGEPDALEHAAAQLRDISKSVGFFYLVGHNVPQEIVDGIFAQSKRLHELPLEMRRRLPKRQPNVPLGYEAYEDLRPRPGKPPQNLVSNYLFYMERGPDDPRVDPNDIYRLANVWPDWMPGFRAPVIDYYRRIENLALKMMPLWARALELPPDFFAPYFKNPWLSMALSYYPPRAVSKDRLFGIKPHTDNTIMSIVAQGDVPGLAIRMPSGRWRLADVVPGALVVNTGNSLSRWTNGLFLSTKHHVINSTDLPRYSVPVFFGADLDAEIKCVPTCDTIEHPAEFPPITYRELQNWYFFKGGVNEKSMGPGAKSEGKWMPTEPAGSHTESIQPVDRSLRVST
jgi:isopenicillin N synthase-like dioxygenase